MVDDTANTNDISNTVSTLTTNEKGADCDSPTAATATAINLNTNTTASRQLCITIWKWCTKFYSQNSLLILILISILLAYAYPPLGATYLAPQVTAKWIAVIIIFTTMVVAIHEATLSWLLSSPSYNRPSYHLHHHHCPMRPLS